MPWAGEGLTLLDWLASLDTCVSPQQYSLKSAELLSYVLGG